MSQDKRDLAHFLSIDCPHCALSEFLVLWEDHHPDIPPEKLVGSLVELLADFLVDAPTHADACKGVVFATGAAKRFFQEIVDRTYKADSVVIERGDSIKGQGGPR